jgi:hypothetical protein
MADDSEDEKDYSKENISKDTWDRIYCYISVQYLIAMMLLNVATMQI